MKLNISVPFIDFNLNLIKQLNYFQFYFKELILNLINQLNYFQLCFKEFKIWFYQKK